MFLLVDWLWFVVQCHRVCWLYYDLCFEIDGVFVSWVVPKGLMLDLKVWWVVIYVEDYLFEYFDFEGVISCGEYGGGDVIVWDVGIWELYKDFDVAQVVVNGELHVELYGMKLCG